jgi:hypothetical protein
MRDPMKWRTNNWKIVYDTPITSDVIGYLTEEDVLAYLNKIKDLAKG